MVVGMGQFLTAVPLSWAIIVHPKKLDLKNIFLHLKEDRDFLL